MPPDVFRAAAELRFTAAPAGETAFAGEIEGHGSVFNVQDSYGDVILPGAFADAITEFERKGDPVPMYAEHSRYMFGGDLLPVGMWTEMREDAHGLALKGRLVAMDHPDVKRVGDLLQAKLMRGLSIAFPTPADADVKVGRRAGEPKRTISKIGLYSVDLVGDPANPIARVTSLKSETGLSLLGDQQGATEAITRALLLMEDCLSGGNSPTAEQRADLRRHLSRAHKALTGEPLPPGMKSSAPGTIREFEERLAEFAEASGWNWSNAQVRAAAGHGFRAAHRDDGGSSQKASTKPIDVAAVRELRAAAQGFSMKFD